MRFYDGKLPSMEVLEILLEGLIYDRRGGSVFVVLDDEENASYACVPCAHSPASDISDSDDVAAGHSSVLANKNAADTTDALFPANNETLFAALFGPRAERVLAERAMWLSSASLRPARLWERISAPTGEGEHLFVAEIEFGWRN